MKTIRFLILFPVLVVSFVTTSCNKNNSDFPTADQYYYSHGGQICEVSTVYVNESDFGNSNCQIVVPTPDGHITFEYPLYSYNNKVYDLTKGDSNFDDADYYGWGYCVYDDLYTYYWAEGPFADSGNVRCRVSRGVDFSAIVDGKFKSNGIEFEINLDLPATTTYPEFSGKVVKTKPESNYLVATVDKVYQENLSSYYIYDEAEEIATVFVKIADGSYIVFEYDLEDYNGVEYDLSKSDSKAGDGQVWYTIAYNSSVDYENGFDKYFFTGENVEKIYFEGTCKPTLTITAPGEATFSVALHAKTSYGRCVDLIYDGPCSLAGTRPLPEPDSYKMRRIANL